jgi:hypothetical protein
MSARAVASAGEVFTGTGMLTYSPSIVAASVMLEESPICEPVQFMISARFHKVIRGAF